MRSPLRLSLAVMLVCSASAWPLSLRQDRAPQVTSPDQKAEEQNQPPTTPAVQAVPTDASNPAAPANTTEEKASPPPNPPVLRHRKRVVHRSSSAKSSVANSKRDPSKVVVRNGGAKGGSPQLTPAVNPAQAKSQRANTANLLAATDANLKRVAGRQLTPAQQSMVDEINTYMRQARAAAAAADTNRAQTLAYKARLLSDELPRK